MARTRSREFLFDPTRITNDPNYTRMSLPARGAYFSLFCDGWDMPEVGVYPDDDAILSHHAETDMETWMKVKSKVATAFDTVSRPGFWVHPLLVESDSRQATYFESQSLAGKSGAKKRWGAHSDPISDPTSGARSTLIAEGVVGVVGVEREKEGSNGPVLVNGKQLKEPISFEGMPVRFWKDPIIEAKMANLTRKAGIPQDEARRLVAEEEKSTWKT